MAEKEANKVNWYPVRVLYGRAEAIRKVADDTGVEFFYPKRLVQKETPDGKKFVEEPLVRSLIFLKATRGEFLAVKALVNSSLIPYYDRQSMTPLVVPEKQMEIFMD